MGRKDRNDRLSTARKGQITKFERQKYKGPTETAFSVDLVGTTRSAWNKQAADVFTSMFMNSGMSSCQDAAVIRERFLVHIGGLRTKYATQQKMQMTDPQALEREKARAAEGKSFKKRNGRRRGVSNYIF